MEANTRMVPTPIAMSSAESEYMAAWNDGHCTYLHDPLHILYLGTPKWNQAHQSLHTTPAVLIADNETTVRMAQSGKLTRKT